MRLTPRVHCSRHQALLRGPAAARRGRGAGWALAASGKGRVNFLYSTILCFFKFLSMPGGAGRAEHRVARWAVEKAG